MPTSSVHLTRPTGLDPFVARVAQGSTSTRTKLRLFSKLLKSLIAGELRDRTGAASVKFGSTIATGKLTISSGSGSIGGVINGVTITATATGVNADDAALVAAAIVASSNALVSGFVNASNMAGTIALATTLAGNWVEIAGVRITAANHNTELDPNTFTMAGNDTADAAALVVSINAHPVLKELVFASSSSGTVTVIQLTGTTGLLISKSGSAITLGGLDTAGNHLASGAVVLVSSTRKGIFSNAITLAASGTGVTASVARLAGGTETSASF